MTDADPSMHARRPWRQGWLSLVGTADWSQRRLLGALVLLPAVALGLASGSLLNDPASGAMAAGGAVAVGFGAFHRLARYRTLPLGVTLLAMSVSTFVASVAHRGGWGVDLVVAVAWGWAFGLVSTLGWGAWWVGLQAIVALLAFGSISADVPTAARHGAMVIAGGAVQLVAVHWLWRWVKLPDVPEDAVPTAWWPALLKSVSPRTAGGRHALRVALALGIGSLLHHFVIVTHGYWVPMTAAILLKPDFRETLSRGAGRLGGTLVGAGLMTLLAAWLRPGPHLLNTMLLLAIWACFALQRVNYALYAVCITAYVVCLLATAGLPEPAAALARVQATLGGAAVALAVHAVALHRRPRATYLHRRKRPVRSAYRY